MSNDPACMTLATEGECIGQWRCGGWFGCIFGDEMIRQSRHDWVTFDRRPKRLRGEVLAGDREMDSVNAKPLRCSCTSPLSGCRCDRPVTADDGLCNYCRASCSRPRPRSLPAGRGQTAALTPTVGRDRQEEEQ